MEVASHPHFQALSLYSRQVFGMLPHEDVPLLEWVEKVGHYHNGHQYAASAAFSQAGPSKTH